MQGGDCDDDDDKVYTMTDVLHEEEEKHVNANAIFGEAEANACMFNMGYIRQVWTSLPVLINSH